MSSSNHHRSLSITIPVDQAAPWQVGPPRSKDDMADSQDQAQWDINTSKYPRHSTFNPKRSISPRHSIDAKHGIFAMSNGLDSPRRTPRRSSSGLKMSDPSWVPDHLTKLQSSLSGETDGPQPVVGEITAHNGYDPNSTSGNEVHSHLASPSTVSHPTIIPSTTNETSSSSESISTVTPPSLGKEILEKPGARQKKSPRKKPNAFSFLDSDSPDVTPERIQKSLEKASRRSPTRTHTTSPSSHSTSSTSSGAFRDDTSENNGDHETELGTSPESSISDYDESRQFAPMGPRVEAVRTRTRSYGTPEMPRGNVQHPHVSPEALTPRVPAQGHPKYLPRAEKLPLTGYQLLASRLSAASPDHYIRPMYRRFETLNHRLLLHLQDEICELEEQLQRLDTADTQNRRLQNCILPASRRAGYMSGGELQWHKTDILGKLGFKLEQYNRVLASFRKTQAMPTPTLAEIHEYRGYLATHRPIAEVETHFLDATDDLICVSDEEPEEVVDDETAISTPLPDPEFTMFRPRSASLNNKSRAASPHMKPEESADETETVNQDDECDEPRVVPLSLAVAIAVILPILTFSAISNYLGRMTVVALVGSGILWALMQGGILNAHASREFCICVGIYGAVMAVIAGIVS
ncbi:hypothetical protein F4779DRAFT_221915 [Xylariaceae sp. FL0662B]|nr:hypothetical protein F4779DRAFT_221915 [Xylariaceae sp. FL0662B]